MSDIRPTLAAFQQRISGSTKIAGLIVAVIIVLLVGLGVAGFFTRNAIVESVFDAGVPGNTGAVWVVTFLWMVAPGILFALLCAVYVATWRWWSFVGLLLSVGLVVMAAGAAAPLRSRSDPPIQPLTELLMGLGAGRPVADAMTDAFWMGLLTLGFVVAFGCGWAVALTYSQREKTLEAEVGTRLGTAVGAFRWIYPVALVVVLAGATTLGYFSNR